LDKDEQGLEREDEIFAEITKEEEDETSSDAALMNEDEAEDEFVQGSIDAGDLATGFNATIPTREIDVDEDTQGDEAVGAGDEEPMTELEFTDGASYVVHGDEIELDLEDVLTIGRTVTEAPEGD
jgi:hypothetical protein